MISEWQNKKIFEIAKIINGGTPKTDKKEYWDGDILWITPKDLGSLEGVYVNDTSRKISKIGLNKSSAKIIPSNSIILSTRAPIGYLAINKKEITTNQGCKGIVPKENVSSKFLYYFLKKSVDLLNELGTGTTFKELSSTNLNSVLIPLPPLPEQQRIVEILDQTFAAIDQAITNTEKNLQNAHLIYTSKLKKIFSGSGNNWSEVTLENLSENLDSKRIPITKSKRKKGPFAYYGASGIVDYVDDYIFDEDLLLISEDGANLVARSTPIAFSVSGKIWVNNHTHILRFKNFYTQKFVEFYFSTIKLDDYITGAAQPKLNQKALNSIKIKIPDLEKQSKIVNLISLLQVETKQLELNYQQKLTNLQELKQSILQKAFNGELT